MPPDVRDISAEDTLTIRQAVLRPHQTVEDCVYPGDREPESFHLGCFIDDQLITIASVYRQTETRFGQFETTEQYRLRGMATLPEFQKQGLGRAVLQACLTRVWTVGGVVLWCNARSTAAGYYRKMGFETIDSEFELPGIGPHYVMFVLRP